MTPHLLALLTTVGMALAAMLRQVIREEVRAALDEKRVTDQEVARYFGNMTVKVWRRTYESLPDLIQEAGVYSYTPGGRGYWLWRISDIENYLRKHQATHLELWKTARKKAREEKAREEQATTTDKERRL